MVAWPSPTRYNDYGWGSIFELLYTITMTKESYPLFSGVHLCRHRECLLFMFICMNVLFSFPRETSPKRLEVGFEPTTWTFAVQCSKHCANGCSLVHVCSHLNMRTELWSKVNVWFWRRHGAIGKADFDWSSTSAKHQLQSKLELNGNTCDATIARNGHVAVSWNRSIVSCTVYHSTDGQWETWTFALKNYGRLQPTFTTNHRINSIWSIFKQNDYY